MRNVIQSTALEFLEHAHRQNQHWFDDHIAAIKAAFFRCRCLCHRLRPSIGALAMLDYVLVRRRDRQDVWVTKAISDADGWTDRVLVLFKIWPCLQPCRKPKVSDCQQPVNPETGGPFMLQMTKSSWSNDGVNCGASSSPPPLKSSEEHTVNIKTGLKTMTPTSATYSRRRMNYAKPTLTFRLTPPKEPSFDAAALYGKTLWTVQQVFSGKAPGSDAILPEVYKHGGSCLVAELTTPF
ncbi:unnamed protein product [Schistocephalus solidus]|uniref:Uncharacterized protein n=1 Tax=Schistocephalus solidus TaxID=70667 RepID=A0A3P7DQM5_SCHSO|nr:unnamed protein product [Schistocephalus solidus]